MVEITIANIIINYPGTRRNDIDRVVPVGPLYVVEALEKNGFHVDFRDYQLSVGENRTDPMSIVAFLEDCSDIVGIGCASDTLPLTILAMQKLKETFPEKIIILGGYGPTGVATEILKNFPFIDIIVLREGEKTMVDLIQCLTNKGNLKNVNGICFRSGNTIAINPHQQLINLDDIPIPSYNKINLHDYQNLSLISSRGCTFTCAFCECPSFWQYRVRRRSISNIIQEFKLLRDAYGPGLDRNPDGSWNKKGVPLIIHDETFTLKRSFVLALCDQLNREELNVQWMAMGRIDLMDDELMVRMAESGCVTIFYGAESGSDSILRKINKKVTVSEIKDVLQRSLDYFDSITTFFIWGFPDETMEDFHQTLELISYTENIGAGPVVYGWAPLPLSPLYEQYMNDLVFSEEYYTSSHMYQGNEIVDLLRKYPKVFPGFLVWHPDELEEKYEIAKSFGLETPFLP